MWSMAPKQRSGKEVETSAEATAAPPTVEAGEFRHFKRFLNLFLSQFWLFYH